MNKNEIGYIYAHIAGDLRYSSKLMVTRSGDECLIVLSENGAVGGMDGPGGATPFAPVLTMRCPPAAGTLIRCIKNVINAESPSIIKAYGKPSKNFQWQGVGAGLSVRMATLALARWAKLVELNGEGQV